MSRLLKGNYDLPGNQNSAREATGGDRTDDESAQEEFERRAFERLGGSIAFVMKAKTFLWKGDGKDEAQS